MSLLILNEWRLLMRRPEWWLLLVVAPLFGLALAAGMSVQPHENPITLAYILKVNSALLVLGLPWCCGLLASFFYLRDQTANMAELINAVPQSRARILFSRFLCFVLAGASLSVMAQVCMLGWFEFRYGVQFVLWTHAILPMLWLLAFITLPTLCLYGAILLFVSSISKKPVVMYLVIAALFIVYISLATATGSPLLAKSYVVDDGLYQVMFYADWLGLTPLNHNLPDTHSTLFSPLSVFWFNRVAVLLCAGGLISLALKKSAFTTDKKSAKSQLVDERKQSVAARANISYQPQTVTRINLTGFAHLCSLQFELSVLNWRFLLAMLGLALICLQEMIGGHAWAGPFGVIVANSNDVINRVMWDVVPGFGILLLVWWSDELIRRDKSFRFNELVQAAAMSAGAHFVQKWLILVSQIVILLLVTVLCCVLTQLIISTEIDCLALLEFMLYAGLPLLYLGTVMLAVQAIVVRRMIAICINLLILVAGFTPLPGLIGITHPLSQLFQTPLAGWDSILGYSANLSGFWAFSDLWLTVAAVLALIAFYAFHQTGNDSRLRHWWALASYPARIALGCGLIVCAALAFNIHQQLKSEQELVTAEQRDHARVLYELRYADYLTKAQPVITKVFNDVQFYPEKREVKFNGYYLLENKTDSAISTLLVGQYITAPLCGIEVRQQARYQFDADTFQYLITLAEPLQPGASLQLDYCLTLEQSGYALAQGHLRFSNRFNYVRTIPFLPTVGYQIEYQLRGKKRLEYALDLREFDSHQQRLDYPQYKQAEGFDWVEMESRITTDSGHTAVGQGELLSQNEQNGRVTFHYKTTRAIRNAEAYIEFDNQIYARASGSQHNVNIEVFYPPALDDNIALTLDATADTIDFLTRVIAPYPGKNLSLFAMPEFGASGYALPQMILLNNKMSFRAKQAGENSFSQVYRRSAHETAHQWFGHLLGNGIPADSAFLVESLAKYTELVLLEKHRGKQEMHNLIRYEERRYFNSLRISGLPAKSMVAATSNADLYSRATLVFAKLRDTVGDEAIQTSLHDLWQQHQYPGHPASSLDFVKLLKQHSEAKWHGLIDQLLLSREPVSDWWTPVETE
ncbi:M1 family aminopeptidase [Neptunicella marina]|uniref:Peptidase M1 membrane alanine aminopeptidase domain-containing protein n=1 Tax=Neptunicella marina TaxID=2125989 RepID=A0A8J6M3I2_9ALTE|nr:M1 family aminopeptidase [Neptunicella marina]MBC3767062.1 hypothetical protein [Neptunicella marina]